MKFDCISIGCKQKATFVGLDFPLITRADVFNTGTDASTLNPRPLRCRACLFMKLKEMNGDSTRWSKPN